MKFLTMDKLIKFIEKQKMKTTEIEDRKVFYIDIADMSYLKASEVLKKIKSEINIPVT